MIEDRYEDGEVIGTDHDGCIICWNAKTEEHYNCGETLEEFGEDNLRNRERKRLGLSVIDNNQE